MNCPSCYSYVSGDFCKNCEKVLYDKKPLKKAIAKRSEKGKSDDLVYRALRLKFLRDNPRCRMFPDKKATTVHHSKGRLGANYLDVSTWIPLSFEAHVYVETHPEWSIENGYSQSRLKTT